MVLYVFIAFIIGAISFGDVSVEPIASFPKTIYWSRSLPVGQNKGTPQMIGGTEIRRLVAFDGKLFAGNSYWLDRDQDKSYLPGAQVFRKDGVNSPWVIDATFDEVPLGRQKRRYHAVSVMEAVSFKTDIDGKELPEAKDFLVVGVWDRFSSAVEVFVRCKESQCGSQPLWTKTVVQPHQEGIKSRHVRSFHLFRDPSSQVDKLFAGTNGVKKSPPRIFSAAYDPSSSGSIRWMGEEQFSIPPGPNDRVMGITTWNGDAYATVCGKVFKRSKGPQARWYQFYRHPRDYCPETPGEWSFRGATTIKNKKGEDHLLLAMEGTSLVGRLQANKVFSSELFLPSFLQGKLNLAQVNYTITAYNRFIPFELPGGNIVNLAGFETLVGADQPNNFYGWDSKASFLVRYSNGAFDTRTIKPEVGEGPMVATRDLIASPFPEEAGYVIYAAGFDGNHIEGPNGKPILHNTGWLYRGELDSCQLVGAACQAAGFVDGAWKSGNGLWRDCINPIMQQKPQRPSAELPLPEVSSRLIDRCRQINKTFGSGKI